MLPLQIPGGPELIVVFVIMFLFMFALPLVVIGLAVYLFRQRSSRVEELEARVEELEAERRGGE